MKPTLLITRPLEQAEKLFHLLQKSNYDSVCFPTLEIEPIENQQFHFDETHGYHFIVFTSINAVLYGKQFLPKTKPTNGLVIAIGQATADAVTNNGWSVDLMPDVFDSETLLAMPELNDIKNKQVLLVTGKGGRGLLDTEFKKRGAKLDRWNVYQRNQPKTQLNKEVLNKINLILATSCESLQNLCDMTPENLRSSLFKLKLLVTSSRILKKAQELGFTEPPLLAENASNEAVLKMLKKEATSC